MARARGVRRSFEGLDRIIAGQRRELEPLAAALHNVSIVGDAHGAVLELLRALDEGDWLHGEGRVTLDYDGKWKAKALANATRYAAARARFVISSTPTPANDDAHEVGA